MSELRQIRAEMMEEFGGDRDALYRYLKTIEAEEARKGRIVVSRPPRRPEGYKPEAA
ncbi:MAG TPA: hypothetical protein VLK84_18165 [Longimicrobium sp.]|nr:hypothetical protein [Longimicrobium sp.]